MSENIPIAPLENRRAETAPLPIAEIELSVNADPVTGLRNRAVFEGALIKAFEEDGAEGTAVALFDLDEFKGYNDTHGHIAGDGLLRRVGKTITSSIRKGDIATTCTASRLGGDEFAVLLRGVHSQENLDEIVLRLRTRLDKKGIPHSMGAALYSDEKDGTELIRKADARMFEEKEAKRARKANEIDEALGMRKLAESLAAQILADGINPADILKNGEMSRRSIQLILGEFVLQAVEDLPAADEQRN